MQRDDGEPVFVVTLERQHHAVTAFHASSQQHIGNAIALAADVAEGKDVLLSFGVAPDEGAFIWIFRCDGVDDIVAEVEIVRIMNLDIKELAVFVDSLVEEFFVNTHCCSSAQSAPKARKRL